LKKSAFIWIWGDDAIAVAADYLGPM